MVVGGGKKKKGKKRGGGQLGDLTLLFKPRGCHGSLCLIWTLKSKSKKGCWAGHTKNVVFLSSQKDLTSGLHQRTHELTLCVPSTLKTEISKTQNVPSHLYIGQLLLTHN